MERELLLTGIGGQGVQLAAQLLAQAATRAGRHVQLFGSYGGMMRGGNTDATLIVADAPVQAPPMVSRAWSAIVMHPEFAAPTLTRLDPTGFVLVNTSIVPLPLTGEDAQSLPLVPLAATDLAISLGNPAVATMVATGAYLRLTGMLELQTVIAALPDVLPPYRRQHVAANATALQAGAEAAEALGMSYPAWPESRSAA